MKKEPEKIALWRLAVVFGVMILFVLGIPSVPGPHHLIYWGVAILVEAALCLTLLPFKARDAD